jgi:hypothetical protein
VTKEEWSPPRWSQRGWKNPPDERAQTSAAPQPSPARRRRRTPCAASCSPEPGDGTHDSGGSEAEVGRWRRGGRRRGSSGTYPRGTRAAAPNGPRRRSRQATLEENNAAVAARAANHRGQEGRHGHIHGLNNSLTMSPPFHRRSSATNPACRLHAILTPNRSAQHRWKPPRISPSVDCGRCPPHHPPSASFPQRHLPAPRIRRGKAPQDPPHNPRPHVARRTMLDLQRRQQTVDTTPRVTVGKAPADADPPSPLQGRSLPAPLMHPLRSTHGARSAATVTGGCHDGGCHAANDGGCRYTPRSRGCGSAVRIPAAAHAPPPPSLVTLTA